MDGALEDELYPPDEGADPHPQRLIPSVSPSNTLLNLHDGSLTMCIPPVGVTCKWRNYFNITVEKFYTIFEFELHAGRSHASMYEALTQ